MPLGIPHSEFLSWDEDDQDKALAYQHEQSIRCGECGTSRAEWEDDPLAYMGDAWTCMGCETIELEQENTADAREAGARGVKHGLITRDEYERRERIKHGDHT